MDSTRITIFLPQRERVEFVNGQKVQYKRWTTWYENLNFADTTELANWIKDRIQEMETQIGKLTLDEKVREYEKINNRLRDTFLFGDFLTKVGLCIPHV